MTRPYRDTSDGCRTETYAASSCPPHGPDIAWERGHPVCGRCKGPLDDSNRVVNITVNVPPNVSPRRVARRLRRALRTYSRDVL